MEKPQVIFVMGGPGAGKGTQCKKIVEEFNFATFSTGDLLRNVVKEKKAEGWEKLDADMKEGKLISSERVLFYLKDAILKSDNKKILVDGYPRNKENLDIWNKMMTGVVDVKAALFFDCSAEEMRKRILGRKEGRADDNEKTILKRIDVFERETRPLASIFEKQGILVRIDCNGTKEEIFEDVKRKLIELNLVDAPKIDENENYLKLTEYRDKYDGSRLYNRQGPSKVYVSKRAGDESDFWAGGKYCYDDPILRKELIYLPNNRESYCKKEIPPQFQNKEHNRTVTRISEYSNAMYNGGVFKNPQFLSC